MLNCKLFKRFGFAVAALVFPTVAFANDGMPPSIFAMVQEGQNVRVTLQIADPGDPGIARSYALKRNSEVETVTVFEGRAFDPTAAVYEIAPTCRWWEPLSYWCIDYPEECDDCDGNGYGDCFGECVADESTGEIQCEEHTDACDRASIACSDDCDGDGSVDCDGWCRTVYRFDVIDACVRAGNYEYQLFYLQENTDEWLDVWNGTSTIEVTESGAACDETGGDGDADGDSDVEGDSDSDGIVEGDSDSDGIVEGDSDSDDDGDGDGDGDDNAGGADDDEAAGCSVNAVAAPSRLLPLLRALL